MASVNKVILLGNLGRDPELRHTANGKAVATLNLATTDTWTDQSGERQERTEWHRVVVWGRPAENCANYLKKGRQVFIEGRIQTRKWQDQEGKDRYSTEVVADRVQFLGGGGGASAGASAGAGTGSGYDDGGDIAPPPAAGDDDIPF